MSISELEAPALDIIRQAKQSGDWASLVEAIPYVKTLGLTLSLLPVVQEGQRGDHWRFELPAHRKNIGNHSLPALHGGAIAGFMEVSAALRLIGAAREACLPRVIDFSIDYLRPGRMQSTYCECVVERLGRRTANLSMRAWQQDPTKPIATARANFLLDEES